MIPGFQIQNPKRYAPNSHDRSSWYPYYAGFSWNFAVSVLNSCGLARDSYVGDPWNGTGTTTLAANCSGLRSAGYDLNPVMAVVAKARLLSVQEKPSLQPLASEFIVKASRSKPPYSAVDPLTTWLIPSSCTHFRSLDHAIHTLLVDSESYTSVQTPRSVAFLSGLAAFFYVALFKTLRTTLSPFVASNPTWIKTPASHRERLRPRFETVCDVFDHHVRRLIDDLHAPKTPSAELSPETATTIEVASSTALPSPDNVFDLVLSSPPYCTRVDYAVATMPELALLGYARRGAFTELRTSLIGSATVPPRAPMPNASWGNACLGFLDRVSQHSSKASSSYYLKSHLQYFASIAQSLVEIARVLKPTGTCVLVVQDSHYKDLHNNLPQIVTEMGSSRGLELCERVDFPLNYTRAGQNPQVHKYRSSFGACESVLFFKGSSGETPCLTTQNQASST
jgi:DNA modification methylase